MSVEMLTYAALGARLNISPQAARSLSRRLRLPRSLSDDGKALVSVDLAEIRHTPRPPRGRASSSALLAAKIEALTAEIARLETTAADHRADFERERERADRLAVELLQATAETTAAQEVTARLEALTAEIARLETTAADHRADFERERERADRLAVELLQATAETTAAQEVTARLEALTAEIARLETTAADHRADFERERERADRLAVELLQATAETTAAQEATARLEALTAEIARLETTAADHRADFERERERADRLAVELLQATAETTAAQEVTARLEALKAEIARLETTAADHRADFERERERADRLAVELLQATAETTAAQEATARLEALTAEIARLETTAADHRADFERERERADRLAVELLQATAETMAAQEVTARLEDEVAALRSGGQSGGSVNGQGQAGRRLGHLAASIVQADRKACR